MSHSSSSDARDVFQKALSELIRDTAIYPPAEQHQGFDLLDIIIIAASAPRSRMLSRTDTKLTDVLDRNEVKLLKERRLTNESQCTRKLLSTTSSWTAHAHLALSAFPHPASAGAAISAESNRAIDVAVVNQTRELLKQGSDIVVESLVHKYFARMIAETGLGREVRKRFVFAVVTGVVKAGLEAVHNQSRSIEVDAKLGVKGTNATAGTGHSSQSSRISSESGIIGVRLLSFVVRCNAEKGTYEVSKGIRVLDMNDDLFTDARRFVHRNRLRDLMGGKNRKRDVFAASHLVCERDDLLDETARRKFRHITEGFGRRAGRLGTGSMGHSNVEVELELGGVSGQFLWNPNGPQVVDDPRNPFVIVGDAAALVHENDDRLRWMLEGQLPPSAMPFLHR